MCFLWVCDIAVCFLAPAWGLRLKIVAAVLSEAVVLFFGACESIALSGERPCGVACDVLIFLFLLCLFLILHETFFFAMGVQSLQVYASIYVMWSLHFLVFYLAFDCHVT